MQIDLGELPETLRGDWVFAYRYSVLPYELTLDVEKIEPRVLVDTLAEAFLEAQELRLVFQSVYRIERAGIFRMEWALPAGYQVRRVWGFGGDGIVPVQVDSHHVTGDGVLVVNLSNRALGAVGLAIELAKDLAEPDLLQPTGNDAAVAIGFGRPPAESVERFGGRFILYAPENLRVNPSRTDGLRPKSPFQEARLSSRDFVGAGGSGRCWPFRSRKTLWNWSSRRSAGSRTRRCGRCSFRGLSPGW